MFRRGFPATKIPGGVAAGKCSRNFCNKFWMTLIKGYLKMELRISFNLLALAPDFFDRFYTRISV